ncbi:hypothetical protein ACLOJK_011161 [Asimina triloba]
MALLLPCAGVSPRLEIRRFPCPAHLGLFSAALTPGSKLRGVVVVNAISKPGRRSRKKRQSKDEDDFSSPSSSLEASITNMEKGLRFTFMEELMERARARDVAAVTDVVYDMIAAGLSPGPRSYHGLIVSQTLSDDVEGAVICLATRGLEILAAMEKLNFDIRQAWLVLVEELIRSNHLEDANKVFLKGAEGGLRATDEVYDLIIKEDCKAGDHSNALTIAYEMEAAGRMATTFHFNCLLSVQATCGIPEVAFATFENMEYGEGEAIRHFRALKTIPGGMRVLYNEGNFGDPLSLYLRALCLDGTVLGTDGGLNDVKVPANYDLSGRVVELLEALEAMVEDKQPIAPRAMIVSQKYRTLVSSWIEPLQEEAELGFEIDYIARYIAEGGLTGERKRWVPRRGKTPLDPDALGFAYSNPMETSFKQRCLENQKEYHRKLLKTLRNEGPSALGNVSEADYLRVEERLKKIIKGPQQKVPKPKAASKMVVSELKEELDAQGLPIDGNRQVLYQRVQKARRINISRGRPLWVPPVVEVEEEVDEELDELISRIKLQDGNTEFWKRRFLGEDIIEVHGKQTDNEDLELSDSSDDAESMDDNSKEEEDNEAEEEETEEEAEQTEIESQGERMKVKEVEKAKPPQMIGVQLLKDSDQTITARRKSRRKLSRIVADDDDDEDWFPDDIHGALKEMRERKIFDVSDMYTIADVWGWTWERELRNKCPRRWSQEWEVELALKIMHKVIELGGTPTIGDCAIILRAAIRAPLPSAFLKILQTAHSLSYTFGRPLYDEVITLCLDLGEVDAAIAIVADMETTGIKVPNETLDKLLSARQSDDAVGPAGNES